MCGENEFVFHPPLEGEGRARSARGGVGRFWERKISPPPAALRAATSPLQGEVKMGRIARVVSSCPLFDIVDRGILRRELVTRLRALPL